MLASLWGFLQTRTTSLRCDHALERSCGECRYGLGQIYFRQEHWAEAETHFRLALDINSRSSVLHCYHGMALHKLERHPEALDRLQARGRLAGHDLQMLGCIHAPVLASA